MKYFAVIFLALFFIQHSVESAAVTEAPDDDDDWEDTSTGPAVSGGPHEADDDGRVYKNPRNSPSAVCPRDEEQATLLGQKCLRKCSSDEDCKSKKKKCLCDGACGMSCIKPDRECPELDKPELGDVTVSGRLFGDKAIYSCPHGYHVVGLQSRNCQADGQWAGQAPACKQNIYCLTPPHIEHARHSALPEQATFDLDATIQYHCHTGYVTNGFPRAKCLAIEGQASWYGPDITCEPRSCGPPGELPHGWVTAECHTFGCRAALHCGAGFELVGRAERFCQSDGTWAPNELPTCVLVTAVQCPTPDAPRHGRAIYTSCAYNSIVSYECKYGYRLIGDNTRRCGADKKWSGTQPVCKEINCGHPGRLYNGWLENIEAGTGLGASIIFRCHDGMRMEGNASTVCQLDGSWSYPLPKCLAPCVVPHVTQGKVILVPSNITQDTNDTTPTNAPTTQIIGSSTMVHHGDALIVECEKNYEFPSASPAVTCNNGTWTQILKCQPARCKRLPKSPKNGMVVAPKTDHGMRARFRCKDGFTLKGPEMLLCSFGNWTGEMPACQEVYCPFPGYIENGKVLLVGNMGLYDYRPYVKKVVNNKQIMYDCDKGYVLSEGPPGATCIGGNWSPRELPNCTLGQHPRLRWSRRRRSVDAMTKKRYLRVKVLQKYYHHLRKRSMEIVDYYNQLNSDMYEDPIQDLYNEDLNHYTFNSQQKYNFDDLRSVLGSHFRKKRQIDNKVNNKYKYWKQYKRFYQLLKKRSRDLYRPYYFNTNNRGYGSYNHKLRKRFIDVLPLDDSIRYHIGKRSIDILPFHDQAEGFIDVLPIHRISKRQIDVLPINDYDHQLHKRFIDILPFQYNENDLHNPMINSNIKPYSNDFLSHRIGKRQIDILPLNEYSHPLGKRSIDILPFFGNDENQHKIIKKSIDVLPLTNGFSSHKIEHFLNRRSIDVLPFYDKDEEHNIVKRSIDVLPLTDEFISHKIGKRQIDILPVNGFDHFLNKRSIDILPFQDADTESNRKHNIVKRSIDILPVTNDFISHRIGKREIDILPSEYDNILNKRSIDILPFHNGNQNYHKLNKRSIDVLPLTDDFISHRISKRQIDILPAIEYGHSLSKRSIDILPFHEIDENEHEITKRSIDILPLRSDFKNHKIDMKSIDILPFREFDQNDHKKMKRSIDILPLENEFGSHRIDKRQIDIIPANEYDHSLNKRSIDILPLREINQYEHEITKRSIDILPLKSDFDNHKIDKRSIDILPFREIDQNEHEITKRSIDILPLKSDFENHKIDKRSIDILPFLNENEDEHDVKKRSIDVLPLSNDYTNHKIDKRGVGILPMRESDTQNHVVNRRSIDILPFHNDDQTELDNSGHSIDKRQIDILPIKCSMDHKQIKRSIDILPFHSENKDEHTSKRSIDILPFHEIDENEHEITKRSIDILPLRSDFKNHKIDKRSIDILPFREIDQNEHEITKRSIDILPLKSDFENHKIDKRSIDILPFLNENEDEHDVKKRSIDVLPINDVLHTTNFDYLNSRVKRDIIGIKNSLNTKKYKKSRKQHDRERIVDEKSKIGMNVNFQENPPLKVDPKDELRKTKSKKKFVNFPKVISDEMTKRTKRTSRKTERLNQTTASVPKSNKDNKGRQVLPPPESSIPGTTSSTFGDLSSSYSNGDERGKGRGRVKGPCDPISSEPYVNVEVVKYGRDPNITYSSGTIVRVACGKGYGLNLGYNSTAKCVRGRWKPMKPVCEILPCHIPVTENGIFMLQSGDGILLDVPLNETMDIENGQVVQFACETGYNVQGASNLRCWHGDWAVTSMPECVPAPCELPVVPHGVYSAGYRPGLTTAHGSAVTLHCERGYSPPAVLQCALGEIRVRPPEPCQSIEGNISSIREGQDFRGGSDIVSEDFDELENPTSATSTDCGPPASLKGSQSYTNAKPWVQGTLIYKDGTPANTSTTPQRYPHGTEVTFRCIAAIMGERSTWKILCDKGKWVGKSVSCEEEDLIPAGLLNNATCTYRNNEPSVVSFYNDLEIKEEVVEFPAGAVLISRCVDIGKYTMIGPNQRKCVNGEWDGSKPSCFGLNQENDYAMEKPPTILFRHQNGPIMQSNDGKLIVYPGTILHMECLWMRKFGNPKWNVSHEYRQYPEGWSSDPGRDSYLEYRLTISHAVQDDSGVFTCITPARQSHQVEIVVEAVHCPPLPLRRGLMSSEQSTKMGSEISFSCANGNSLIGASKITCLPSGNWSAPLPLCESVECGEVVLTSSGSVPSRPRVSIVSRGVGGRAAFSCGSGWGLKGPTEIVCSPSGEWTPAPPICIEVSCPPPAAPVNGYLLGKAPFRAGDVVQFNCNPAHMMQGQPIVACQDNARWSGETPKCIQACSYPGTTISGRMSSVKFYYKIGETISFTCEPGLVLRGAPMLRCLRNGKWSNAIPICSRESSSNDTYLTGNDSDQLLNDAPILSEYTSTEPSLDDHSSSHSQISKTHTKLTFAGPSTTTNTPPPVIVSTQKEKTGKPETKPKYTKSKTFFKFNQEMFILTSTLPTIVEETNKITQPTIIEVPTQPSTTSNAETEELTTETIEKVTEPTIHKLEDLVKSTDEVVTEVIILSITESTPDTSTEVSTDIKTTPNISDKELTSTEETTTKILTTDDPLTITFKNDILFVTDINVEQTTEANSAKLKELKMAERKAKLKKCQEDYDEDAGIKSNGTTEEDSGKAIDEFTPLMVANLKLANSSEKSLSIVAATDKSLKDFNITSTTKSPSSESRRTKNKVSLDLLSLFQEIDKLENKNNITMYGMRSSRKKDLSRNQEATNEEIAHIKRQLGIESNTKRKLKNR